MRGRRLRPGRGSGELGSASVLGVQVIAMLAVVTLVCCGAAALVAAHRRAQTAADLGALAGATAIQQGAAACPAVARVVVGNHARLRACVVTGQTVQISVLVRTPVLMGHSRDLTSAARAGPTTGSGLGDPG